VTATAINSNGSTSEFSPNAPACSDPDGNGNSDDDADGLCDNWETNGIDLNGDGIIDLPLNQAPFNASRTVPDIFVEVDWMDCAIGGCAANHASHKPVDGA